MAFDVEAYRAQAYQGKRVVVMGYGLYAHGSGIAATRYLAEAGQRLLLAICVVRRFSKRMWRVWRIILTSFEVGDASCNAGFYRCGYRD